MSPEVWQRVKSVVEECLDLEPDRRSGYLDSACQGDLELRREAESLLACHEEAGEFLERPAIAVAEAGQRLGPWLLGDEIGHGGMGRIYHAVRADGLYEQRAAVKVLRRGMDTDAILSHFQSERQILASLNHPNVARLLDGGATPDGRPFFVMEFIEGKPLDQYVAQNRIGVRDRLRLFQQVCGAVQYAHQRLVVHRDIKPANILVTQEGVPKLLDFGIAKIMAPGATVTMAAARMMTPAYASPEQIAGEPITTASDVYSLGVVLYELLAGKPPHTKDSRERAEDPELPSTAAGAARGPEGSPLREELRGDLDNIVLKALENDPAQRYASAAQLSEDIQRYLTGLPVLARKHTLSYRMSRFVRRNRVLVAAGAALALALVGGFAATLWQYRIAQAERLQAEQRFQKLRKLANSVIHEFHDSIADLPGTTKARALMLTRAMEYLDGLAAEAGSDVTLRLELAEAYRRIGDVKGGTGRANLGNHAEAVESYKKAIGILEAIEGEDANRLEVRASLARLHNRLGGPEHAAEAVRLTESLQGDAGREALADSYFALADASLQSGDYEKALEIRLKDLAIRKDLAARNPANARYRANLALVSKRTGGLLIRLNRLEEAFSYYAAALEIDKAAVAADPVSVSARTALSFDNSDMGFIRMRQGRLPESLAYYRETVRLRDELFQTDDSNVRTRLSLASSLWRLAQVLSMAKKHAEAVPMLVRSIGLITGSPPGAASDRSEDEANARLLLGRAYAALGSKEARSELERARSIFASLAASASDRQPHQATVAEIDKDISRLGR